uniref:NR LBD domain-containing protein n=1 Tax=Caenorhabditis tropicalis TaxID=1561998 RepID=A0A1I7TLD2_9PELO
MILSAVKRTCETNECDTKNSHIRSLSVSHGVQNATRSVHQRHQLQRKFILFKKTLETQELNNLIKNLLSYSALPR